MPLKGILIEESLTDWRLINQLDIRKVEVCESPNPGEALWHIYTVILQGEAEVSQFASLLKPKGYYAHFGNETDGYVVFPGKVFKVDPNAESSWQEAIRYGSLVGVPPAQLDFSFHPGE